MVFGSDLKATTAVDRSVLYRIRLAAMGLAMSVALASGPIGMNFAVAEGDHSKQVTKEECDAAMDEARKLADVLATDHPSRTLAERLLEYAKVEATEDEFGECVEQTEKAVEELRTLRQMDPERRLKILGPNEYPPDALVQPQPGQGSSGPGR